MSTNSVDDCMVRKYYPQIDIIKGIAIISVILLHTFPERYLVSGFAQFYIWQAVPIFFVVMGLTLAISSDTSINKITNLYSKKYFLSRFNRIIMPFLLVFIVSFIIGIISGKLQISPLWVIGLLPLSGPGNYFITLMFEFIVISPFIIYIYRKRPATTIISLFLLDMIFELAAPHISMFSGMSYLYSACILRYFWAIGLGLLIAPDFMKNEHVNLIQSKYWYVLLLIPLAIVYLALGSYYRQPIPIFNDAWRTQNIISFSYTILITTIIINIKPINSIIYRALSYLGKASYHIFLVQILFFGAGLSLTRFVNDHNLLLMGGIAVIFNLVATLSIGLIFYRYEPLISAFLADRTGIKAK